MLLPLIKRGRPCRIASIDCSPVSCGKCTALAPPRTAAINDYEDSLGELDDQVLERALPQMQQLTAVVRALASDDFCLPREASEV